MSSLTATLASFVVSYDTADIPEKVWSAAQAAMVDTLGCALAGVGEPVSTIAAASIQDAAAGGESAGLWGTQRRGTMADAAFVNAIATHALDFDDNLPTQRGHPSTTVLPAALAVAGPAKASGADLIAAYAIGIEVSGKLGPAAGFGHYVRGWHPTSTIGIFGATAAVARLLRLNALQTAHAWGIAASQTSGLVANFGTMTKPFNAGHAARCAVTAALLARAGFTANTTIFDGETSVLATYGGEGAVPLKGLLETLAAPWEIVEPGIFMKRWPCCYCSHRPLSALLTLIAQHGITAQEVESIAIGFPPGSDGGLRDDIPTTGLGGKFSVEYTAAAAVLDGHISMETFTDAMVQRPAAQALLARVHRYRIPDERRWSSTIGYNDVRIETRRGVFSARIEETPGSPSSPLTPGELDAKFTDCAQALLGQVRTDHALRQIRTLAQAPDCQGLLDALSR